MSRTRQLAAIVTALALVSSLLAAPVGASVHADEPTEPPIVRYGGDRAPSFVVHYETDSLASLEDWANASTAREIEARDTDAQVATVSAPYGQVLAIGVLKAVSGPGTVTQALTADPLATRSYIESVSINYRLTRPDPVTLENQSAFETPTIGALAANDPPFPTEGLAFASDANETSMAEVRSILGNPSNGTGVTVAVVDTGINTAQGQLFGNGSVGSDIRISNASASFLGSGVETVNETDWSAITDNNGHGTWTASAIAANHSGTTHDAIANNATLLGLKALDEEGQGSTADIAQAVRYAADHNADIISLSLGSQVWSEPIATAVQYALDNGVQAVVVASGNSRPQVGSGIASPGDIPGVITVGATNGSAPGSAGSAYFSQVGPTPPVGDGGGPSGVMVDVAAPGMQVTAKVATTDGSLTNSTLSGTSMATPEVASGIAAAMATNSTLAGLDDPEVQTAVQQSAKPVPSAAEVEVGHGMFQADNLATGTYPDQSQADAMDSAAEQRDAFYRAMTDTKGGFLAGLATVSLV